MTRARRYNLCALLALPLFALRLYEIVSGEVESPSGFLTHGAGAAHWLSLALGIAGAAFLAFSVRGFNPSSVGAKSVTVRACLASAALATAGASAAQLMSVFSSHELAQFFMTRAQLTALGIKIDGFRLAALCAVMGLFAAAWFGLSAIKGELCGSWALSLAPSAWFALRAVVCFARGPINANNTVTVSEIAACMVMAAACAALSRTAALEKQGAAARRLVWLSALGLYFAVGFALPNAYFHLKTNSAHDALFTLALALAALCAALFAKASLEDGESDKEPDSEQAPEASGETNQTEQG